LSTEEEEEEEEEEMRFDGIRGSREDLMVPGENRS
jgi:hypothetical protein